MRYTRVPAGSAEKTTWLGADGSRITYVAKSVGDKNLTEAMEAAAAARLSVPEFIAENRREMTKISWTRVYRRYPELGVEGSPARTAFESFVEGKRADPREASTFENPSWPEMTASAFIAERRWRKAESASWDRVRARVRIFNDPESIYTTRFMSFAAGLRSDPETADIFQEPTWPEKALDLHDQQLGPVPLQFR